MVYMIYSADDLDKAVDEDMIRQHRRYIESFGPRIRTGGPYWMKPPANRKAV